MIRALRHEQGVMKDNQQKQTVMAKGRTSVECCPALDNGSLLGSGGREVSFTHFIFEFWAQGFKNLLPSFARQHNFKTTTPIYLSFAKRVFVYFAYFISSFSLLLLLFYPSRMPPPEAPSPRSRAHHPTPPTHHLKLQRNK